MLDRSEPVIAAYVDARNACCNDAARATLWTYVAYVRQLRASRCDER